MLLRLARFFSSMLSQFLKKLVALQKIKVTTLGGIIMGKRSYTHTQILLPEIRAMVEAGKTQREIAEHFGFSSKEVVRELLKRERRKEAKLAAGIMPRPKGRPRKDALPRDVVAEQAYEINRLKMENKLLRDFLQLTGRK